ncbi:class I adenylate-forming enzyme family protein [Actinokineospora sp.]|uniref:class I adenylate-forming enzyme family protein n=1 Tax=Actinokineospora sp. TaxID=1872133 RepID=UPI00403768DF
MTESNWVDDLVLAGAPDRRDAVRFIGGEVSYARLRADVRGWSDKLSAAGAGPGVVVAVQIAPSVDYLTALLGALRLGAQVLLIDFRLTPAERAACLRGFRPRIALSAPATGKLTAFQAARDVELTVDPEGRPAETEHCVVQFSSGSTGLPKVIGRTSGSIIEELDLFAGFHGWVRGGDVVLALNSLAHSFGLVGVVLHALRSGATVAFADRALPKDLRAALTAFAPTAVSGVPAHFDLLATLDRGVLDGVRVCVSGGELMTEQTYTRFAERHRRTLGQSYGLTEVGMVAGDAFGVVGPAVGWVSGNHRVRVVDGQIEIAVAASPYLSAEAGDRYGEGWLRTGDRGTLDERGVLTPHGRNDSMAVVGGLKIDLTEIEQSLLALPEVDEAVVLITDGVISAFVGSSVGVGSDRLHQWCAERLAPYKIPRRFQVGPTLPRTTTGKLLRRADQLTGSPE